jgi:hypothetical protein
MEVRSAVMSVKPCVPRSGRSWELMGGLRLSSFQKEMALEETMKIDG